MKKILENINKRSNKTDILGWLLVVVGLFMNSFIILRGSRNLIHSDGATAILFAREQWFQKRIFPEGWCYGTDIWNIGLNTLILPFFKICDRWVDARACAVFVQTLIMVFIITRFKKIKILNNKIWLVILFMLLPASEVVSEHWYFQATYMTIILFLVVMIILTFMMFEESLKTRIVAAIILLGILCLRISMGYMMILVFALPMLATIFLQIIKEYHNHNQINKQIKKYVTAIVVISIGVIGGVIYNNYLIHHLNYSSNGTAGYRFIANTEISISGLLQGLLRLYGAADKSAVLISLSGILKPFGLLYMIIMLVVIPFLLFKNFNKLKNDNQRKFIVFSILSSLAVIYIYIFTGMEQSRYLLWIYFYTIILLGIFIDNYKVMKFEYKKEIKNILITIFFVMFSSIYVYYLTYDYKLNPDILGVNDDTLKYKADYELVDYMEENNYKFGYAPYWIAYSNSVISDGKVKMAALEADWSEPYLWLTSENLYKETSFEGECFILIRDDMMKNLPGIYQQKAIKEDRYQKYTIYVFDSINTIIEIWNTLQK